MRRIIHPNYKNFFTSKLLMTSEAANGFVAEAIEFYLRAKNSDDSEIEPTYTLAAEAMAKAMSSENITLTTRFQDTDIPDDSIALHRIHGTIFADYDDWGWYFSTKQFVDDIRAAEENPKILAHLFHINSGGGEAWYLDVAAEAVKNLKKPVMVFAESVMASAAYYLAVNATRIYSATKFDIVGSIGTMVSFINLIPLLEKYGAKYIEAYADQSSRKNKKYNDLTKGKPEQFTQEVLNPLAEEFIQAVKAARPAVPDNDRGVFQGETFFTQEAADLGLIDGRKTVEEIIQEIYSLGMDSKNKVKVQQKAITQIFN